MSELRLIYCGKRKLNEEKLVHCFLPVEDPSPGNFKTLTNTKSIPYPIGTVISFEVTEDGKVSTNWGKGAKPHGLFEDRDLVRAWELESRVDLQTATQQKALSKEGNLIDKNISGILEAIERLPHNKRQAARVYVVSKLMRGS